MNDLSISQKEGLRRSIELGRRIQRDYPKVAEMYEDLCIGGISRALDIAREYGVSEEIAQSGIRRAIKGHNGKLRINAYLGLLDEETYRELGKKHLRNGAENSAELHQINGTGIYGMSEKERIDASHQAVRARGLEPWSQSEQIDAFYMYWMGFSKREIVVLLNKNYHGGRDVRNFKAVEKRIGKVRRSLEEKV